MFGRVNESIYNLLDQSTDNPLPDTCRLADNIANHAAEATASRSKEREVGKLWASDLGKPCMRQQWFKFHMPDKGEDIQGHTYFKFLYGNVLEELALELASHAGHEVSHQQERVETEIAGWRVSGKIDAVIDNVLIDVKSTSTFGFNKYKAEGLTPDNDSFGYLWQLGFYHHFGDFGTEDAGFLWIDKQNGHLLPEVVTDKLPTKDEIIQRVHDIDEAVNCSNPDDVPRGYEPVPYGKAGNMSLSTECSYCPFKKDCWSGLKAYAYSNRPVFFTEVKREPNVPRLDI